MSWNEAKAVHLLENAIPDDAFDTLRSHCYDLENRDPNIPMDTLTEVLAKTTMGSVQGMGAELSTLDAEKFDSFRHYLNQATFLQERVNNAVVGVTDKAMHIIHSPERSPEDTPPAPPTST